MQAWGEVGTGVMEGEGWGIDGKAQLGAGPGVWGLGEEAGLRIGCG